MSSENTLFVCEKCQQVPKVEFTPTGYAIYHCDCGNNQKILIEEYIQRIESPNCKPASSYFCCKDHPNQKKKYYCETCKKEICEECKTQKHEGHSIKSFDSLLAEIEGLGLEDKLVEFEELEKFSKMACNRICLRMKQEISKLENSYKRTFKINQQLKKVLAKFQASIAKEYQLNYNTLESMKNTCIFNLNEGLLDGDNIFEQLNCLIKFYENNRIFKLNPLSKITTAPKKEENLIQNVLKDKLHEFQQEIDSLVVLSDKKTIATVQKYQSEAKFFDINTFSQVGSFSQSENITDICEIPDKNLMVTSSYKGIRIFKKDENSYKFNLIHSFAEERGSHVVSLSNNRFAVSDIDSITIYSTKEPYSIITKMMWAHFGDTNGMILLKDGRLCSGGGCNDDDVDLDTVKFWNLDTYTCMDECTIFDIICYTKNSLKELNNNKLFVGGASQFDIIDLRTYIKEISVVSPYLESFYSIEILNENCLLVGGRMPEYKGSGIVLYEGKEMNEKGYLKFDEGFTVEDIRWIADKKLIVCGGKRAIVYQIN